MENSKLVTIVCIVFFSCALQVSSIATNQTGGKLLGELSDTSETNLQEKVDLLAQDNQQLHKEIEQLKSEVDDLKKLQDYGDCAPCKPIQDSDLCDCTDMRPLKDCLEFLQADFQKTGLYKIQGPRFSEINVFCDQTSEGGGFTTILRRQDGSVNFERSWQDYKSGFGTLLTEFWFGNENMHDLTKPSFAPKSSELLINMRMKGKHNQYSRNMTPSRLEMKGANTF